MCADCAHFGAAADEFRPVSPTRFVLQLNCNNL